MSLSVEDYTAVAEVIRRNLRQHHDDENGPAFLAVATVARELADYFTYDNPDRFDFERFFTACGLQESSG